jgi:opine dehydrogenase
VARYAVFGAGPGGQTFAAVLAAAGHEVALYVPTRNPAAEEKLAAVRARGIRLSGALTLEATPALVTDDLAEAATFADTLLIVTPAMAHRPLAAGLAPQLREGQLVVLNPGRTGGAFEVQAELRRAGCRVAIPVAESASLAFTCRLRGPAEVLVADVKRRVSLAALPAEATAEAIERLAPLPRFAAVETVLVTSLENLGPAFHVVGMLLNAGVIERGALEIYYQDGVSPAVARVMEAVDGERLALARAYGVSVLSAIELVGRAYAMRPESLYQAIQQNEAYRRIGGVPGLAYRYLVDDVPASALPMAELAGAAGLASPLMNACVDLSSSLMGTDYRRQGRTLAAMGLAGLDAAGIQRAAQAGLW